MFPHRNILKYTRTSPDGKIHNQMDHVLIERKLNSSINDVLTFRRTDCDAVAKVRERLAVSKHDEQKFDGERFNLRKLNELEVKKQYQIKISI